ncbi:LysR family transcriptional regulator [Bordetella avium]|uniref:LysR-family transcriptional regulator n=1 Tax=Bordetella avium (strain 197N) TaxID=360910 RepID=Q2KXF1_BORA1|nr:LysR substrate-binding domain-containing protein [Bordetella avium]AZY48222.1 LysR family transcriptional regulator [Bordetella avium]AZY51603.1 LysR family transcriptional regulator [Bordetella avium]RIQ13533.1 LysR family transcriptional regulator [Bordetella avium]RIQ16512.1 LysR family transcriptional regulator [Bordetella avium]RIQ31270.1 LysR family transcriptional regulator [Bordetella avium]
MAGALASTQLTLRQIEVFHAIMLTGSLSEAGRMLSVTQPAISRLLASAENRLRYRLFERVKGRLHPTPEARRLMPEAEAIFERVGHFNSLAGALGAGRADTLTLVSSPSLSEWLIPQAIQQFRQRHPATPIRYRPLAYDALLPQLLLGQADFGIASMPPPANAHVISAEVGQGWLGCAVPLGHPLAGRRCVRPEDLQGHLLIGYDANTPFGRLASRFLHTVPLSPQIEIRSTPEALALVRQGIGVALVEGLGYHPGFSKDFVLLPTEPCLHHPIHLLHAASSPLSATARRFVETLRALMTPARGSPAS